VSDPTYRIEVTHVPTDATYPWRASIYRISDDTFLVSLVNASERAVLEDASARVSVLHRRKEPYSVLVDDDGQPVEAHSVKA